MANRIGPMVIAASLAAAISAAAWSAGSAAEQAYPSKPINWITFSSRGGGGDQLSRVLATAAERHFGQPWHVENITGASGLNAWREMLRRPADGHTIFLGSPTTNLAVLKQNPPILDSKNDIRMVAYTGAWGSILLSLPNEPWSTWKGLKAYAEQNPGKLTIAGSEAVNIGLAYLFERAGIRESVRFIPYDSTGAATTDFLGGHVKLAGMTAASATKLIPTKAVGVLNAGTLDEIAGVPNARQLGYDGIIFPRWVGVHPQTPQGIVSDISNRIGKVLGDAKIVEQLAKMNETATFTPHDEAQKDYLKLNDGIKDLLAKLK